MKGKTLVTHASGFLGRDLVLKLKAQGCDVVAASRTTPNLPLGIPAFRWDLHNQDQLRFVLRDVENLVLISPLRPEMLVEVQSLLRAAKECGVRFVLRLSTLGANALSPYPLLRIHGEAEDLIREQGPPCAFLRPNVFMQNFLRLYRDDLQQGILYMPEGEAKTSFVDARDVIDAAAEIVSSPDLRHVGEAYTLTGPKAYSIEEALNVVSLRVKRRLTYVSVTEKTGREILQRKNFSPWLVEMLVGLHAAARAGLTEIVTPTLTQLIGAPLRNFESFCEENRLAWRSDSEFHKRETRSSI